MYDLMIRQYVRVYEGTLSPLCKDWDREKHKSAFDYDEGLIRKFEQYKAAEEHHCECSPNFQNKS